MARTTDQPASAPHRRTAGTDLPCRPLDEQGQDDDKRETGDYRDSIGSGGHVNMTRSAGEASRCSSASGAARRAWVDE